MDAIFAYELWNKGNVLSDKAPFSLTAGRVTAANGLTYDMASASDRKRIIDDGFVFLIDQVRASIRAIDPTALVTMGFFHDTEPNPARRGDNRLVRTCAIERSTADFVDIHPYADDELTFPQFMQNYGIDGPVTKPIIMGEFGGSKRTYRSATQAAEALVSWQRQSCAYGIDGGCSGPGIPPSSPICGTHWTQVERSNKRCRRRGLTPAGSARLPGPRVPAPKPPLRSGRPHRGGRAPRQLHRCLSARYRARPTRALDRLLAAQSARPRRL